MIDHGTQSGSGHLIRSGQIINSLVDEQHKVFALIENYSEKKLESNISRKCNLINLNENFLQITRDRIQDLLKSIDAEILVIDSYKIKDDILPINDSLKIFRIMDEALNEKKEITYLPIGIRFPQEIESGNKQIDYPIRDLSEIKNKRNNLSKKDKLLVYLGTSPTNELVQEFINVILKLHNEIKQSIVFYLPLEKIEYFGHTVGLFTKLWSA
jgi:spore coat polysaccharide biosynthesis predicted glycosyltransferase SpsG